MGKLVPEAVVSDKRVQKFLNEIREACKSPGRFRQKIDVNVGHIAFRAAQTGADVRNAMDNERIASMILNGTINDRHCRMGNPIELAFEGVFAELKAVVTDPVREVAFTNVPMRVVVRQGSSKHIVVTLYPLQPHDVDVTKLPEVPRHVW